MRVELYMLTISKEAMNLQNLFLQKETHVVGTLRANKKDFPKEVLMAKLRRSEMIAKEDQDGIVVLKWRDTRDV